MERMKEKLLLSIISTPIIPLVGKMTTIQHYSIEKSTTIIVPSVIVPHARKTSIITQPTKNNYNYNNTSCYPTT